MEDGQLDGLVGYAGEPLRPVPTDRWTEGGDWILEWKPPGRRRTGRSQPGPLLRPDGGLNMNGPEFFMYHAGLPLLPPPLKTGDAVADADTLSERPCP